MQQIPDDHLRFSGGMTYVEFVGAIAQYGTIAAMVASGRSSSGSSVCWMQLHVGSSPDPSPTGLVIGVNLANLPVEIQRELFQLKQKIDFYEASRKTQNKKEDCN